MHGLGFRIAKFYKGSYVVEELDDGDHEGVEESEAEEASLSYQ